MSQGTASALDVVLGAGPVGENVAERSREMVFGATFVRPEVTEVPLSRLEDAVPSYPTGSEVWLRLLETYRSGNVIEG